MDDNCASGDGSGTGTPILALRILHFEDDFEINEKSHVFEKSGRYKKKVKGLDYLRYPVEGLTRSEASLRLAALAGAERLAAVEGIYYRMASIAADRRREHRGWILDSELCPLGPGEIANFTGYPQKQIAEVIDILRRARLVEWLPCPFARKSLDTIRLAVEGPEFPEKLGKYGNPLINQNQKQRTGTLNSEPEPEEDMETKVEGETGGSGDRGEDLRGLPSAGSEGLESDNLKSEDLDSGSNLNSESGDLSSETLPRAGGRQSVQDTRDPDGGRGLVREDRVRERGRTEPDYGDELSWEMRIGGMNVDVDDPGVLEEDLYRGEDDRLAREQIIERAMIWLRQMLPEYLDPPATARDDVRKEARGSETTVENILVELWEIEKQKGVVWFIRLCQRKRIEAIRSRGRMKNLMGVIVAKANEYLGKPKNKNKAVRDSLAGPS